MSEWVRPVAEQCVLLIEALGAAIIAGSAVYVVVRAVVQRLRRVPAEGLHEMRRRLGAGILLGLEFLVGADIIHTVAVELTFESVGVLAVVVLIRTFLSFSLELELTGRWPWQQGGEGRR